MSAHWNSPLADPAIQTERPGKISSRKKIQLQEITDYRFRQLLNRGYCFICTCEGHNVRRPCPKHSEVA